MGFVCVILLESAVASFQLRFRSASQHWCGGALQLAHYHSCSLFQRLGLAVGGAFSIVSVAYIIYMRAPRLQVISVTFFTYG